MLKKISSILLLLVWLILNISCTNIEPVNTSITVQKEQVNLCEITENISSFDGKFVKIKASIRGFHHPLLYSDKCSGVKNVILMDLNRETFKELLELMSRVNSKKSEINGKVILEGRIEKDKGFIFDYEYEPQIVSNKSIEPPKGLTVSKVTSVNILSFTPNN